MEAVHASEIKNFLRCRLMWRWTAPPPRGFRLEPLIDRPALHFGRLIHQALQEGYDSGVPFVDIFKEMANKELAKLPESDLFAKDSDKIVDQTELGVYMLEGYQQWAKLADQKVKFISTEVKWYGVKLGNVPFAGRFDAVVERDDGLWILDFKTSSTTSTDWTMTDLQATAYVYAARQLIDPKIRGLLFRFLLKKKPYDYNQLILKKGDVTTRKNLENLTTYREYLLALAVATLQDLAKRDRAFAAQLDFKLDEDQIPHLKMYADLLDGTQFGKPWHPVFKNALVLAQRMHYQQLQNLKGQSSFFWEVPEFRTSRQVEMTVKHVLAPAAKEMVSRRKSKWVGPTGLGAAFAVCRNCSFQTPCEMVMRGASPVDVLRNEFRVRREEIIE